MTEEQTDRTNACNEENGENKYMSRRNTFVAFVSKVPICNCTSQKPSVPWSPHLLSSFPAMFEKLCASKRRPVEKVRTARLVCDNNNQPRVCLHLHDTVASIIEHSMPSRSTIAIGSTWSTQQDIATGDLHHKGTIQLCKRAAQLVSCSYNAERRE